jgi:short-subunit dehydrogenase
LSVFGKVMSPSDGAVWITGASAGIGRDVALKLANRGFVVYATARNTEKLERLSAESGTEGQIIPKAGDVTDAVRMREIVKEIEAERPLALAVLNAGIYVPMRAQAFNADTARDMIDVNLIGVTNALDPVLSAMTKARNGHVAIMASVAGYRGLPGAAPYSASKAGLIALCEALAMDLVDFGVRISVVNPGFVETDATSVNEFEMPFLMKPNEAADRIVDGLFKPGFEIAFPRRFAFLLRTIGLLPNRAYIWAVRKMTGWGPNV